MHSHRVYVTDDNNTQISVDFTSFPLYSDILWKHGDDVLNDDDRYVVGITHNAAQGDREYMDMYHATLKVLYLI